MFAAPFASLGTLLSSHRAVTRVSLAALSFTILIAFSQQAPATQAGPEAAPLIPESLLPQNVGIGVSTDNPVTIDFGTPMDPLSVEAALQLLPIQAVELSWSPDLDQLTVAPEHLWRTDESYLLVVGRGAARTNGTVLERVERFSFTTQTAPSVTDFQVRLAGLAGTSKAQAAAVAKATAFGEADALRVADGGVHSPAATAKDVSASSAITVSFSTPMNHADVEDHFAISPAVDGELSWDGDDLVFTPTARLDPGGRYTISVVGSHDRTGNVLGGEASFSFLVQPGAQLIRTSPKLNATDVEPVSVDLWFSQPMAVDATNEAFALTDTTTDTLVAGRLNWNEASTQLTFTPDEPFGAGRTFEVAFDGGARDADGNAVDAALSFTTRGAPTPVRAQTSVRSGTSAVPVPAPAPATSLAGHALNQVNAARAAYGFGPVVLDDAISAVASAHAWDQATNGYFSHTGSNGSTRESRLRAGGVSFGWSGENQCYHVGMSEQATLDWCHAQFMAEPYPGHWNHIANILNPNARRMGVGIANVGGRVVIVWDFTD